MKVSLYDMPLLKSSVVFYDVDIFGCSVFTSFLRAVCKTVDLRSPLRFYDVRFVIVCNYIKVHPRTGHEDPKRE